VAAAVADAAADGKTLGNQVAVYDFLDNDDGIDIMTPERLVDTTFVAGQDPIIADEGMAMLTDGSTY
jgi:hypothetical protein